MYRANHGKSGANKNMFLIAINLMRIECKTFCVFSKFFFQFYWLEHKAIETTKIVYMRLGRADAISNKYFAQDFTFTVMDFMIIMKVHLLKVAVRALSVYFKLNAYLCLDENE